MANDQLTTTENGNQNIRTEKVGDTPTTVDLRQVQGDVTLELGKTTRLVLAAADTLPSVIKNRIGDMPYALYVDRSSTSPANTHDINLRLFPIAEKESVDLGPGEDTGQTFGFASDVDSRHARIRIENGTLTVVNFGASGTSISWQQK